MLARGELLRRLFPVEQEHRLRRGEGAPLLELRRQIAASHPDLAAVLEAATPGVALTVAVTGGPHAGLCCTHTQHVRLVVGRSPGLPLSLPQDREVSKVHCVLEFNPPRCQVEDNKSTNGTWVNGRRIEGPTELRNGDLLRLGKNTTLVVSLTSESDSATRTGDATAYPITGNPLGPPRIPGYLIEEELGRGGMGVVFKARALDGRRVAIKTILPGGQLSPSALGRFQQEMQILQGLRHPNIVSFLESGSSGEILWFAMEYVEGCSAAALLSSGPVPVARCLRLGVQLLDALVHAHGLGYVHRDIKPGNLLVQGEPGSETLKLADFGLARAYHASTISGLCSAGAVAGTFAYMAPDQLQDFHSAQGPADQYSVAATLYHLLAGRPVYESASSTVAWVQRILQEDPWPLTQPPASLPSSLVQVLNRALSRAPERRYPSTAAFREALKRLG